MRSRRAELCTRDIPNTGSNCPAKQLNRLWSTKSSEVSAGDVKMELQMMGEEDKSRYCYFPGLWSVLPLFKIIFVLRSLKFTLSAQNVSESGQKLQQVTVINNS